MRTIMFYTPKHAVATLYATNDERLEALRARTPAQLQEELAEVSDESDPIPVVIDHDQFYTMCEHEANAEGDAISTRTFECASDELLTW